MKQKTLKLIAALLSLTLLFSVLAVPASALSVSTGIVRTDGAPSGMTLWLTVGSTLVYTGSVNDLEYPFWSDSDEEDLREGKTVHGTEYIYDSYQAATVDTSAYAGLSQAGSKTIYWYSRTDYEKWIKGLQTADVNWADGTITMADGTRYTPCSSSSSSSAPLTLSVGGFAVQGATALLVAGGIAAVAIGVKLYDDPTILERARQKAQDLFGGIADTVTGTVQGWFAPDADAPAEEAAASSAAEVEQAA
jgi:hypothetical protein